MNEIQLRGPNIPNIRYNVIGCPVIDGWQLCPVMNPNNGAPINLGKGVTGSVDLIQHAGTGYLLAVKKVFMQQYER